MIQMAIKVEMNDIVARFDCVDDFVDFVNAFKGKKEVPVVEETQPKRTYTKRKGKQRRFTALERLELTNVVKTYHDRKIPSYVYETLLKKYGCARGSLYNALSDIRREIGKGLWSK